MTISIFYRFTSKREGNPCCKD